MNSLKPILLPFSVFLTGASVLIVEVVGVRVLSPFYGNTIFTVSSVISVILLALSCGYYLGGRLAELRPSLRYFFALILISGLVLLFFYFLGTLALPLLSSRLSILTGPLVSATLLFLFPAFLLGTLCPYAVKLQSVQSPGQGAGRVAGNIFFWSTLGSIAGSLSAGFVLIPRFGIDQILIANGVILSALGLVPLFSLGAGGASLWASGIAFALALGAGSFAAQRASRKVLYTKDGFYQKITIYDGSYAGRPARFFQQDENSVGAGEGAMFLDTDDPTDLVYDYTRYYALYKIFKPQVENALIIGGGAYSIPKAMLRALPGATVDVTDIEPSLFSLAKRYFRVPESPRLHNYVEDGRRYLRDSTKKYDLIFSDVYYSFFSVPPHFATQEFFSLAKQKLAPDGILIANMIGDLSRQQPSLILAEIKTFQTVFPNSYFFAVAWPERTDSQNVILVGYNSETRVDWNSSRVLTSRDPLIRFLSSKVIDVPDRFDLSGYPVLTDNFSPVEFLTAKILRRAFAEEKPVDGDEMLADVDQQERYALHYSGMARNEKVRNFLLAEMKLLAQDVKTETWSSAEAEGKTHESTNIIARFYTAQQRIVLATHYGMSLGEGKSGSASAANDGSGVAVLVELARSFSDLNVPPDFGIDLAFLEGSGTGGEANGSTYETQLASEYFARHLSELYGDKPPVLAILLDDVCRANLRLLKEGSSMRNAAAQTQIFWKIAQRVAPKVFPDLAGWEIEDGQGALVPEGIPSVVLIDSEYPHFSTGNCSARSLESVGRALMQFIRREQATN